MSRTAMSRSLSRFNGGHWKLSNSTLTTQGTMIHTSSSNNDSSEETKSVHDHDDYVYRGENEVTQWYTLDNSHPFQSI